ncbi:STAS domain-containing protein [Streptomyces cellulosae]|uniref:STAS domain-containing protein n=1 Tax=Streptomyces cellulosae TaxID=1968 RepID=A0ABW7YHI8_STRCE
MDSSGINVLIAAHQSMRDAHGWLRLASARESRSRRPGPGTSRRHRGERARWWSRC